MEFTLLGAALAGVVPLWAVLRFAPLPDGDDRLLDAALTAVFVGLAAGRIAAMVVSGTNPLTRPADILIVRSGVSTGWASLAGLAWLAWAGRPTPLAMADRVVPAALAALAGWHGGCLVRDACLGTPSDLPWAFALAGSSTTRHPVELYAALAFLVAALGAWLLGRSTAARLGGGLLTGLGMTAAAATRLLTEPLRPTLGQGPVAWYALGVAVGLVGVGLALWRTRRAE